MEMQPKVQRKHFWSNKTRTKSDQELKMTENCQYTLPAYRANFHPVEALRSINSKSANPLPVPLLELFTNIIVCI